MCCSKLTTRSFEGHTIMEVLYLGDNIAVQATAAMRIVLP